MSFQRLKFISFHENSHSTFRTPTSNTKVILVDRLLDEDYIYLKLHQFILVCGSHCLRETIVINESSAGGKPGTFSAAHLEGLLN